MRLAQTGHLLTPFVDDAEGRSHDASHANRAVIEINYKKPATERCTSVHRPQGAAGKMAAATAQGWGLLASGQRLDPSQVQEAPIGLRVAFRQNDQL